MKHNREQIVEKINSYIIKILECQNFSKHNLNEHIYYKMLEKIIAADYDVYNNDIKIPKIEKVGIALGVWVKYNLVY